MSKIIDDFQVYNFRVIRVESIPDMIFSKVKIDGDIFLLVPTYDIENCVAFEYDGDKSFTGKDVEFI